MSLMSEDCSGCIYKKEYSIPGILTFAPLFKCKKYKMKLSSKRLDVCIKENSYTRDKS